MSKPETTACWYRLIHRKPPVPMKPGLFHQWGSEVVEAGAYTVGIVEDAGMHSIHTVAPEDVHFGGNPV